MIYVFGEYGLDNDVYELRRAGMTSKLEPKAFNVLAYLIHHHDRIVPKDELLEQLWDNQHISDAALNSCIMAARKAVGDSGNVQQVIQTHRGRGYRFIAPFEVQHVPERDELAPQPEFTSEETASLNGAESAAFGLEAPPLPDGRPSREHELDTVERWCLVCEHPNGAQAAFCVVCGTQLAQPCPHCSAYVPMPAFFCHTCGRRLDEVILPLAPRAERMHSPLAGREDELDVLRTCVRQDVLRTCVRQVVTGQGQVVDMVGEAGMGKSRLLSEVRRHVRPQPITYVQGACLPSQRVAPGVPIREILRQCCGLTAAGSLDMTRARLEQRLRQFGLEPDVDVPYLLYVLSGQDPRGALLAQTPDTIKIYTLRALRRLLCACSKFQPLILAVEDIQWIDQTSEDCLVSLAACLATVPVLLLVTRRPGPRPAWLETIAATQIALQPLSVPARLHLVRAMLASEYIPPPLEQAVMANTAGNPAFVTEITYYYVESGAPGSEEMLPTSLDAIVTARLDRLPRLPRLLVQTASILGRAFSLCLLRELWDEAIEPEIVLQDLEPQAWGYAKRDHSECVYVFAPAMLQELIYASLPVPQRQTLHAAAVRALETCYAEHLEPVTGLLAWHYVQAGQPAKALPFLTHVAQQAAQLGAYTDTVTAGQQALEQVERLPAAERARLRLPLVLEEARALTASGLLQESVARLQAQHTALVALHDVRLTGQYACVLSQTYSEMGEWEQAAGQARQAVTAAQTCRDEGLAGQAYYVLAMERYRAGAFREGATYSRQAVALLERPEQRTQLAMAHFVLGLHSLILEDFSSAFEAEAQTRAIGVALGDLHVQAYAAWATGWIHATCGDWENGIAACQQGLACAPDPLSAALVLGWLGHAYLEKGDAKEAVSCLERAIWHMQQCRYARMQGLYTTFLGAAYLRQGDMDKAREHVRQGLDIVWPTQDHFGIGWGLRMLGRVAETCGHLAEAQQKLSQALQAFHTVDAAFEVARTRLALAGLVQLQGDHDAATHYVRDAYHQFATMDVPLYVQRAQQRAADLGLSLSEIAKE